jgi:hypothetical protein
MANAKPDKTTSPTATAATTTPATDGGAPAPVTREQGAKVPATAASKPAKKGAPLPKKYEVRRTINLGRDEKGQPRILVSGDTIGDSDLPAGDLAAFLGDGTLADGDAPIPPSQAEGLVAFDRLARIALATGAAGRDGGTYTFGGREFKGIESFRKGVTLDELETAILVEAGVVAG